VELIKDYDCVIDYHPIMVNVNVVTNALIQKERAMVDNKRIKEHGSLVELKKMGLWLSVGLKGSLLARLKIQSVLQD
jgi:hypothetical protein